MKRAPIATNARFLGTMIRHLQDVPSTVPELAEASGLHTDTVRSHLFAWKAAGAVRVVGWEQDRFGRYCSKVYAFGQGADAKRPAQPKARREAGYRARRAQMSLQNAICGVNTP